MAFDKPLAMAIGGAASAILALLVVHSALSPGPDPDRPDQNKNRALNQNQNQPSQPSRIRQQRRAPSTRMRGGAGLSGLAHAAKDKAVRARKRVASRIKRSMMSASSSSRVSPAPYHPESKPYLPESKQYRPELSSSQSSSSGAIGTLLGTRALDPGATLYFDSAELPGPDEDDGYGYGDGVGVEDDVLFTEEVLKRLTPEDVLLEGNGGDPLERPPETVEARRSFVEMMRKAADKVIVTTVVGVAAPLVIGAEGVRRGLDAFCDMSSAFLEAQTTPVPEPTPEPLRGQPVDVGAAIRQRRKAKCERWARSVGGKITYDGHEFDAVSGAGGDTAPFESSALVAMFDACKKSGIHPDALLSQAVRQAVARVAEKYPEGNKKRVALEAYRSSPFGQWALGVCLRGCSGMCPKTTANLMSKALVRKVQAHVPSMTQGKLAEVVHRWILDIGPERVGNLVKISGAGRVGGMHGGGEGEGKSDGDGRSVTFDPNVTVNSTVRIGARPDDISGDHDDDDAIDEEGDDDEGLQVFGDAMSAMAPDADDRSRSTGAVDADGLAGAEAEVAETVEDVVSAVVATPWLADAATRGRLGLAFEDVANFILNNPPPPLV